MLRTYSRYFFYGLSQVVNYRSEIFLAIFAKIVTVGLLLFLWNLISEENNLNVGSLVPYFLIAHGIQGFVESENMRFGRELADEIKLGLVSSHLVRPINVPLFLYVRSIGSRGLIFLFAIIFISVGVVVSANNRIFDILAMILMIFEAIVIGFGMNLLIGSISFWTPEARNLRHVIAHIARIFSGLLIPLSFFPDVFRKILAVSPFPVFGYAPAGVISGFLGQSELRTILISGAIWMIVMPYIAYLVWRRGLKHYEAVGI